VIVDYTTGNRGGKIMFTPLQAGITTVSVKVTDAEGAFITQSFELAVFENINGVPTIDQAFKSDVVNNADEQLITLTGISDGDDGRFSHFSFRWLPVSSEPMIVRTGGFDCVSRFTPAQGIQVLQP
jgi:hypothetical protein